MGNSWDLVRCVAGTWGDLASIFDSRWRLRESSVYDASRNGRMRNKDISKVGPGYGQRSPEGRPGPVAEMKLLGGVQHHVRVPLLPSQRDDPASDVDNGVAEPHSGHLSY